MHERFHRQRCALPRQPTTATGCAKRGIVRSLDGVKATLTDGSGYSQYPVTYHRDAVGLSQFWSGNRIPIRATQPGYEHLVRPLPMKQAKPPPPPHTNKNLIRRAFCLCIVYALMPSHTIVVVARSRCREHPGALLLRPPSMPPGISQRRHPPETLPWSSGSLLSTRNPAGRRLLARRWVLCGFKGSQTPFFSTCPLHRQKPEAGQTDYLSWATMTL